MRHCFSTARAVEIAVHCLRERKQHLAVLADEEISLFFILPAAFEFFQHELHIFPDRIKDVIGAQLPEIG